MTVKIFNLTQHKGTPDQTACGLVEPNDYDRTKITSLLTFRSPPTVEEIRSRAQMLVKMIPSDCGAVMLGGAGYLLSALEREVRKSGRLPWYSYSERVSTETTDPVTGVVSKSSEFKHLAWVSVPAE